MSTEEGADSQAHASSHAEAAPPEGHGHGGHRGHGEPADIAVAGYRGPDRRQADRRHVPGRRGDIHKRFNPAIRWMTFAEIIAYLLVSLTLLVMALVVIYRGGDDVYNIIRIYITGQGDSATWIIDALSNFLFVVILMELLATLITHIRHETFQVKPFLIIGIISGVRQILLIGAKLSLNGASGAEWRHAQIDLGVNAGIDLALVLCLVLIRHFKVESDEL